MPATRVAANDEPGRLALCKYILRPPLANDRLTIIDDDQARLAFKKPWSDGTSLVEMLPLALIARLAALVVPSGPWACPPCTCPTRLRRAHRRLPAGTSRGILACSPRTAVTAASACRPPCPRRRKSQKTSPRALCRCRTMFPGASFPEERSRSTRHALAARARCGLSLSSRRTTPSRRFCRPWGCPRRRPSFVPRALHRRQLAVRMGTCRTDRASSRAGWGRLPRVSQTPSSEPRQTRENPTRALPARGRGLDVALRQGSPTLENPIRNAYGPCPRFSDARKPHSKCL
ncbi:MAG: transposase [Deltaproteobacteria bacterium]|nr:transposase [Deltaproteobacteria bacterium]